MFLFCRSTSSNKLLYFILTDLIKISPSASVLLYNQVEIESEVESQFLMKSASVDIFLQVTRHLFFSVKIFNLIC